MCPAWLPGASLHAVRFASMNEKHVALGGSYAVFYGPRRGIQAKLTQGRETLKMRAES
tara:strand:- start:3782 stop:3955 length:174 start_codon:yes stop_codon:yes gene_type:complete